MRPNFEPCDFSPDVLAAANVAIATGEQLTGGTWSNQVIAFKPHPTFVESSVTEADGKAHDFIVESLRADFPDALFNGEEMKDNERPTLEAIQTAPIIFSDDAPDGTTPFARDLAGWCVSLGVRRFGVHIGGVIVAPDYRGGFIAVCEVGKGFWIWERGNFDGIEMPKKIDGKKRIVVAFGVDVQRREAFSQFRVGLPEKYQPREIATSGALGLALAAAGRFDVLVQAPQMPWDFDAGISMVMQTRAHARWYHIVNGRIVEISRPNRESYRTDKQILGFVIGHEMSIVNEIFLRLVKTYGKLEEAGVEFVR